MAQRTGIAWMMSEKKKSLFKKIFTRLALIFISVLFTLLVLEVTLRIVYDFRFRPKKRILHATTKLYKLSKNKNLVYELRPKSNIELKKLGVKVEINSFGFRDKEYSFNKGDKKRVIFIGDSLTYGWVINLHETYHKQLEELLRTKNYDVDVMGMGIVGYNTVQEYYLIKEKALKFNPDIIVLQITPNDFRRTLGIQKEEKNNNTYSVIPYHDVAVPYVLKKNSITHFFMRSSYLYKFINLKLELLIKKWDKNYNAEEYFLLGEEKSFRYLERIKELLDKEGIKFATVIFPNKKKRATYRYASLHKRVGDFLTKLRVPFIDLYLEYNIKAPEGIWMDSIHPNAKGYEIAATKLFDFLLPMLQ